MKQIITVIGLGRVGLPMALVLADNGFVVHGIGKTQLKIDQLKKGILPFAEEGLDTLTKHIGKTFFPTTSYEVIRNAHVIILSLGTPIDENMNPVLDQIDEAMESMLPLLKKG